MLFAVAVTVVARVARATSMLPVPSNEVPPMLRALARAVAVAARATAMLAEPSNEVPPMLRAVSKVSAVSAFPVRAPIKPVAVTFPVDGL